MLLDRFVHREPPLTLATDKATKLSLTASGP